MKQKIIIGLSVVLFLAAVFLIVRDLFQPSTSQIETTCCDDDFSRLKRIDTTLLGYTRVIAFETGLKGLTGISVNQNHKIILSGHQQLVIYDSPGTKPKMIRVDSTINCLATTGENIYAGMGASVVKFSMEGEKLSVWEPYQKSGYITSIAANNNLVVVADAASKRILKYLPNGSLLRVIGEKDTSPDSKGFVIPSMYFEVAHGTFDDLWVVNPGYLRLENYNQKGEMRSSWGKASYSDDGFTGCCNPAQMAVLPDGSFVTYEKGIDKIKVFDPAGQFRCYVGGAGSFKGETDFQIGNLNLVKDIAVDSQGDIYVLDLYNRINIFRKK